MRYPVLIEPGTDTTAFGVVVPDLPGCFSAGDTLDEALANAEEAVAAWVDAALDQGGAIPAPSSAAAVVKQPGQEDWIVAIVQIDPTLLDDTIERVNITLPRRVLQRIDAKAKEQGATRSGYIAKMAIG